MFVTIAFTRGGLGGRISHNLLNVNKTFPVLKHCIRQIDEDSGMYYLRNNEGEIMAECHFDITDDQIAFTLFGGKWKKDLQKMLTFLLVEEIGEKAHITTEKMVLFFDLDNFFLREKDKSFKIGTDYESIISVDNYHIPLEIRSI